MIRTRNVDPISALRPFPLGRWDVWLPEEDADAVIAGATTAVGVKTLNGTGIFANGDFAHPYMLCFTLGTAADTFTYEVDGTDIVGNNYSGASCYRNNKSGAGAASSTAAGTISARPIIWRKVTRFEIIATTGSGTLDVGFLYGTATALLPRIPLPYRVGASTELAGVKFCDQGGGTIVPAPPSKLTLGTLAENGNVIPVAFTTYTAAPTLPMRFRVALKTENVVAPDRAVVIR